MEDLKTKTEGRKGVIYFCLAAMIIVLLTMPLFVFLVEITTGTSKISLQIVNFGFAILLGIAAVCFSWFRTLDKEESVANQIRLIGESSLIAGIFFLVSSILIFFSKTAGSTLITFSRGVYDISLISATLFALIAFGLAFSVLFKLMLLIRKRLGRSFKSLNLDQDIY